jgi:hypothetical protein
MLPLTDPRWENLVGCYSVPYNPAPLLAALLEGSDPEPIWEELWNELHHQGDVRSASYAAVPYLCEFCRRSRTLDWNPLGIIAVIELERPERNNPPIPDFLARGYHAAIQAIPLILAQHPDRDWNEMVFPPAMACIAASRGHRGFARAYLEAELPALRRWIATEFGWDESVPEDREELGEFFPRD